VVARGQISGKFGSCTSEVQEISQHTLQYDNLDKCMEYGGSM